ncbi:prolyl oligopeptidase family serine peptidase [Thalassotalea sp. HSM 43]|uniref:prolyl oligopeptidase family serine peptidase n=1 Tax=Thalassotalea sp. HSM 43 TaxID=2552945 RepID=UPI001675E517|nr:prolyl oligopeptidase family serine peptidase [Thalassotalea sp. HSM 43]
MPNKLIISCLFALVSFSSTAGEPLHAEELYKNSDHYKIAMRPDGKYIVSYDRDDDYDVIELIDPNKETSSKLIEVEHNSKTRISDLNWIDNQSIFVSFASRRNGIIKIDYSDGKSKAKWRLLEPEGRLVDSLPNIEGEVLFAHKGDARSDDLTVYKINIKDLYAGNFDSNFEFVEPLDDALYYRYDRQFNAMFSATFDDDEVMQWYFKLDDKDGEWIDYNSYELGEKFTPAIGFISDSKIAVLSNETTDLVSLVEFDLHSQEFGEVLFQHNRYDLTDAGLNPDGSIAYVTYFSHGLPTNQYFHSEHIRLNKSLKKSFPEQSVSVVQASLDDNALLVSVRGSDNPGQFYYFDVSAKKLTLVRNRYEVQQDVVYARAKSFDVKIDDDTYIEAILTLPTSNDNGVLIVNPHGGPVGVRDYAVFNRNNQYLASRGYAVLNVNFRGSSGFGKEFLQRGKEQFGQLIEQDISAVVSKVEQEHNFERMCSMGSSYGGYSAMMLAIYHPDKYECVISNFGIYDLPHLFNASNLKTQPEFQEKVAEIVGDFDESLKDVSPIFFAEKLQAPVLLMAGEKDTIADFEQANRMKYRLKQLGKDMEYLFYANTGHGHKYWSGDRHEIAYIDDFIRRKLDLPLPEASKDNDALAYDKVVIADAFEFDDNVANDEHKAAKYYQQAADLGHARAMFNIGSYYHRGIVYQEDIEQAVHWYQKSSDAGRASASIRLGDIYQQGQYVETDYDKSYQYYQQAQQQETHYGQLYIAQAQCLGQGVEFDFEQCMAKLFYQDLPEHERRWVEKKYLGTQRSVISTILWQAQFDDEQLAKIQQTMKEKYKLDIIDVAVDEVESGVFKPEYYRGDYQYSKIEDGTTRFTVEKDVRFGTTITLEANEDLKSKYKSNTMLVVHWLPPKEINEYESLYLVNTDLQRRLHLDKKLSKEELLIPGDWTLEVRSLTGTVLHTQTFNLTADEESQINQQISSDENTATEKVVSE